MLWIPRPVPYLLFLACRFGTSWEEVEAYEHWSPMLTGLLPFTGAYCPDSVRPLAPWNNTKLWSCAVSVSRAMFGARPSTFMITSVLPSCQLPALPSET